NIPQPGGKPIQVIKARPGTTPGVVTGPDHKVSKIVLPPGPGTTPGIIPGPNGKPIQITQAGPGMTPGAVTGPDQQVTKIVLPSTPSPKQPGQQTLSPQPNAPGQNPQGQTPQGQPQQPGLQTPGPQPKAPGQKPQGQPQQPGQQSPISQPNSPGETPQGLPQQPGLQTPSPQPNTSGQNPQAEPQQPGLQTPAPQLIAPGQNQQNPSLIPSSLPSPIYVPQPSGQPIRIVKGKPGTTPGALTGPDHKISQIVLPSGPGITPGNVPDPNGRPINVQPVSPGTTPGVVLGPNQQVKTVFVPSPGNFPQYPGQNPSGLSPQFGNNGLSFQPHLPNSNGNIFSTLPNFQRIFRHALTNGNERIPSLITAVLQSKGQSPDTLNLREFIRGLSAVFGVMRYENDSLSYSELYVELLMETLISALEVIRSTDSTCIAQPTTIGGIPKYINAFYDILI
ncbi:aggregate spidroin 2A variant 1, partial [Nephila pilipes]